MAHSSLEVLFQRFARIRLQQFGCQCHWGPRWGPAPTCTETDHIWRPALRPDEAVPQFGTTSVKTSTAARAYDDSQLIRQQKKKGSTENDFGGSALGYAPLGAGGLGSSVAGMPKRGSEFGGHESRDEMKAVKNNA